MEALRLVIYPVKTYNERYPGVQCLFPDGRPRKTGYVLFDFDDPDVGKNTYRKWFPNKGQAKIERDTPGKYGERGIKF